MSEPSDVVVDFDARGEGPDEYRMVLVENGPWTTPYTAQLEQLQTRMYGCIDAAIDGQLLARLPESKGKKIPIEVHCYDSPKAELEQFCQAFSEGVFSIASYQNALQQSYFISDIDFRFPFFETD